MHDRAPERPAAIDPLAEEILENLRRFPESREIVLGGYFALQHYLDYRSSHDLDAWWRTGKSEAAMDRIREAMQTAAARRGMDLKERQWGETVSFELIERGRKVFSFQIALRSIELEPPHEEPWHPILLESLADNVGAKMNALVERGAARDFLDIRELVNRGIVTVEDCWRRWEEKNPGQDSAQAKAHVLKHLEALEMRRPLHEFENLEERQRASGTRSWVRESLIFCDG